MENYKGIKLLVVLGNVCGNLCPVFHGHATGVQQWIVLVYAVDDSVVVECQAVCVCVKKGQEWRQQIQSLYRLLGDSEQKFLLSIKAQIISCYAQMCKHSLCVHSCALMLNKNYCKPSKNELVYYEMYFFSNCTCKYISCEYYIRSV